MGFVEVNLDNPANQFQNVQFQEDEYPKVYSVHKVLILSLLKVIHATMQEIHFKQIPSTYKV